MILQVPGATAVTRPVVEFTVAKAVFELDQVPPASPLEVYVVVAPMHNGEVPVIVPAFAFGLIVIDFVAETGALHPDVTV
jgi:hypothetical protein